MLDVTRRANGSGFHHLLERHLLVLLRCQHAVLHALQARRRSARLTPRLRCPDLRAGGVIMSENFKKRAKGDEPSESRRALVGYLGMFGAAAFAACAPDPNGPLSRESVDSTIQPLASSSTAPVVWFDRVTGTDSLKSPSAALFSSGTPADRQVAIVAGYYGAGDGGGGAFFWDSASTAVDDGGITLALSTGGTGRWRRIFDGPINVKWFGATGDGTTNDRAAIQRAVDFISDVGSSGFFIGKPLGNTVYVPPGEYVLSGSASDYGILIRDNNICLTGAGGTGPKGTKILLGGVGAGILIEGAAGFPSSFQSTARGTQIRNLSIYNRPSSTYRDGIVVHAHAVSILDCLILGASRHGILIGNLRARPHDSAFGYHVQHEHVAP